MSSVEHIVLLLLWLVSLLAIWFAITEHLRKMTCDGLLTITSYWSSVVCCVFCLRGFFCVFSFCGQVCGFGFSW